MTKEKKEGGILESADKETEDFLGSPTTAAQWQKVRDYLRTQITETKVSLELYVIQLRLTEVKLAEAEQREKDDKKDTGSPNPAP